MILNEKYNDTIKFALSYSSEFYNVYTKIIKDLPEELLDDAKTVQHIRYELKNKIYEIAEYRNQETKKKEVKIMENDYRNKGGFILHVCSIDEQFLNVIKEKEIISIATEKNGQCIDCTLTLKKENNNEYVLTTKTTINKSKEISSNATKFTIDEMKKEFKTISNKR